MIIYEYGSPGSVPLLPRIPHLLEARIGPPSSATVLRDAPQAEQFSPWSLDGGRKVVFTSLPHVASDAVAKFRALMAPMAP